MSRDYKDFSFSFVGSIQPRVVVYFLIFFLFSSGCIQSKTPLSLWLTLMGFPFRWLSTNKERDYSSPNLDSLYYHLYSGRCKTTRKVAAATLFFSSSSSVTKESPAVGLLFPWWWAYACKMGASYFRLAVCVSSQKCIQVSTMYLTMLSSYCYLFPWMLDKVVELNRPVNNRGKKRFLPIFPVRFVCPFFDENYISDPDGPPVVKSSELIFGIKSIYIRAIMVVSNIYVTADVNVLSAWCLTVSTWCSSTLVWRCACVAATLHTQNK